MAHNNFGLRDVILHRSSTFYAKFLAPVRTSSGGASSQADM